MAMASEPISSTVKAVELGLRLRARRDQLGLTAAAVGRITGIGGNNLSSIEIAKRRLTSTKLHELAGIYEVSGDELAELDALRVQADRREWWDDYARLYSDEFLRFIGIDNPPGWTTSASWSMPAVLIVGTWREMGYYMLLYLAGLQTIPTQLYEAATVDGAGAWQRFWHVTVPGLRHTTFLVTVLLTIGSFKVFDLTLLLTQGGPGQSTLVLSHYIYQKGFEQTNFGYASAISVVLFVICFGITIVQYRINRRGNA